MRMVITPIIIKRQIIVNERGISEKSFEQYDRVIDDVKELCDNIH